VSDWWEEETGMDLPSFGGSSGNWEYIPTDDLTGDPPTFAIDTEGKDDPTIQYDADNSSDTNDHEWRPVPSCDSVAGQNAAVCTFTRGDDSKLYVMAQDEPAPPVRYKHDAGAWDRLRAAIPDIPDAFGDFINDAQELIDDLLPEL
jgi:hypothetical protein